MEGACLRPIRLRSDTACSFRTAARRPRTAGRAVCLSVRAVSSASSTTGAFQTSAVVSELLACVQDTDSGAAVDDATRARIATLVDELEAKYEKSGTDPRTDPALIGDYRVVYTSSPQAAGGRFRSGLGRALFRTHALYQNVLPSGDVANRVEFQLFGCVPGAVGLQGPFQPVEPLVVAPAEDVVLGDSTKGPAKEPPRTFKGAVEVRFGVPYFEIAGTRVSIGGASTVRLATTYLDGRMRLGRGGFGSLFVFEKMGQGEQAQLAQQAAPAMRAAGAVLAYFGLGVYYAASALLTTQRLAVRAAKNPAVGFPALLAAAALAASLLAPAASASLLASAAPPPVAWAAHLGAAACWGASLAVYGLLGETGPLRDLPRKLVAPVLIQAQTKALAVAAAAGAVAAAAFAATGAAAADPFQRLLLSAALACTFLDLTWAQPLRGQLQSYQLKLEKDAGIGEEALGAAPDKEKMTPTLERLRVRVGRWHVASGLLTAAGAGALGAHLLCFVAGRLAGK